MLQRPWWGLKGLKDAPNPLRPMGLHGINLFRQALGRHKTMQSDPITTTKKELVQRIAEETGQTKSAVRDVMQAFLDSIIRDLGQGKRLEFREFGIFETKHRDARTARNPHTNAPVEVPAQRVVKFKPGSRMRELIAGGADGTMVAEKPKSQAPSKSETPKPPLRPTPEPPKAPPTTPGSPF